MVQDIQKYRAHFFKEYVLFTIVLGILIIFAFLCDSPENIFKGLIRIMTSRSILITDYMEVGGTGAMLINGAIAGVFALTIDYLAKVKPNGATIMAFWLSIGFGFFGKNLINMIPLTIGVWLYSKYEKEPFISLVLSSTLVATLSPVVSELIFGDVGNQNRMLGIVLGTGLGILLGFIFTSVSALSIRIHDGYDLYNMGFAGGLIAMLLVAILKSFGVEIDPSTTWGNQDKTMMCVLIYGLSIMMIAIGYFTGDKTKHISNLKKINRTSGRLVSDYYILYRESAYINMGTLGIAATTIILILGININGPTMGGIFTIMGFGCFGKHLKNVMPVMLGAILASILNTHDPTAAANAIPILFCTGLAPIAGQFGVIWGFLAGFVHVSLVSHASYLSNGLNLYSNGFAAAFVVMIMIPIITIFQRNNR